MANAGIAVWADRGFSGTEARCLNLKGGHLERAPVVEPGPRIGIVAGNFDASLRLSQDGVRQGVSNE